MRTVVVKLTISLSLTASSLSLQMIISFNCGYSAFARALKFSIDLEPLPFIFNVSRFGQTAMNAAREVFPITPGPMMETTFESFLARYLAPTPGIPPVR